jgi:molybdenum cofactor biosynthesis protein B
MAHDDKERHHGHGHHGHAHAQGDHHAHDRQSARCLVITVSDTRTLENDRSGERAIALLEAAGHEVREREIVHDDRRVIASLIRAGVANREIDAVILTGGTGIAPRDVTHEAVAELLERRLDGFGELFRMLSFQEIGAAAMLSRAIAGVIGQTAIFALPGSTKAVELGVARLIAPELRHIVGLLNP